MKRCLIFEEYEDELFQQLNIMGLALRSARKTSHERWRIIHIDCGLKAADKVDDILRRIRDEKVIRDCDDCS